MAIGLLDTSVVIDWHDPAVVSALPDQMAISAITVAEPAAGPRLATTPLEAAAAGSYGLAVAAVVREGRGPAVGAQIFWSQQPRTPNGLDLGTRNSDDFVGLAGLVDVVAI